MNILVTGGAGYIGSHAVKRLVDLNHKVFVLDDLSHGFAEAIHPKARLFELNMADESVSGLLKLHSIEAVMHFAAFIEVGESVQDPLKYYENNFNRALRLFRAMLHAGVKKLVFSSTAAVYGNPKTVPIPEDSPTDPINPYGRSKKMVENLLSDLAAAQGLGSVILRYFNVGGAAPDASIGEAHQPESHLIPRILDSAAKGKPVSIFGDDYPTKDGTCIRDYVHVEDLISAHVLALDAIQASTTKVFNVGSEKGFSVLEVLQSCEKVLGKSIKREIHPRRPGDPAELVASSQKIRKELGWKPKYPGLDALVEHAWKWHSSHPHGYSSS